ncbi:hypothetical protein FG386_001656 [Cryptosporidium ryanae]|uniref:uncharacterized protein n=1 Tax=Cryptosporidium ryanae TaxID=515981 RepID=UPI00351A78DC|nr:hypothetical protein FG386_001656 [Cryptosporidium ryanae]
MCDHFWFDYRIWCLLFRIDLHKINSITEFVSKYTGNKTENFNYNESEFFKLENNNLNYKLIRDDAKRFRPSSNLGEINYPEIPKKFYGVNNICEFISEVANSNNYVESTIHQLLNEFENDTFSNLSETPLVDRIVIVTIIVCEYLGCSYLQGMHDIIGCLSFLKSRPFPITLHILLAIEVILKWGRFLLLPSLFNYYEEFELNDFNENKHLSKDHLLEYETQNTLFGFIYNILFEDKVFGKHNPNTLIENNLTVSQLNEKYTQAEGNKMNNICLDFQRCKYKKCGNYFQCTIKQLLDICNEFQMFGNFHAPLIFNKIERFIESNTWCCGVFVTCGSSLFLEIQNVLLFWLNLLFCSSSSPYKPPYYPKIKISLQIPAFLVAVLKVYEHKLKDDVYLICTEEFKLDSDVNLHTGIVSILQPFLITSENIRKDINDKSSIIEYIEDEKRPIFVDLFQIILVINQIIVSTPLSLQERLTKAVYYYSPTETIINNGIVNYINPTEFILYDSMFFTKRRKVIENISTIITGKDIVIIDIISDFHTDHIFQSHSEEFIEQLKQLEKDLYSKKFNKLEYDFDEKMISVLLLPILRLYLKTTRIVKIPLSKDSNIRQVTKQFIEFSLKRQKALLIQKRPSIWIVLGPNNHVTDKLILTLLEQGITGIQLMNPLSLINELIDNEDLDTRNESLAGIVKEVINNLIIGNLPSSKNRMLLKSRSSMTKEK